MCFRKKLLLFSLLPLTLEAGSIKSPSQSDKEIVYKILNEFDKDAYNVGNIHSVIQTIYLTVEAPSGSKETIRNTVPTADYICRRYNSTIVPILTEYILLEENQKNRNRLIFCLESLVNTSYKNYLQFYLGLDPSSSEIKKTLENKIDGSDLKLFN